MKLGEQGSGETVIGAGHGRAMGRPHGGALPVELLGLDASRRFAAAFSRSTSEDAALADGLDLVTIRAASQMCSASLETVELWMRTGLWPLPCAACRNTWFFHRSDVQGGLATGEWAGGTHFRIRKG